MSIGTTYDDVAILAIPEPGSLLLVILGFGSCVVFLRWRK
ncbi:MAG: PEP-CTERM sorting domain-containing protein [Verrucomicrobia bacterium]|nr:PEP-CTERM sorting domain-containing protein [Verrucomicrobiota bacterium]MCH8514583.1 PEP-CTERM sorting domain-containing protein [Kiritimatiellia bacterium]